MNFDTITKDNQEFALVPVVLLEQLNEDSEMLADIQAYETAKERLRTGEDEIIPFSIVERRIAGESTVKIWREYRNMTQQALAEASGVTRSMIAAIESGSKTGSIETIKKLSIALNVDVENLI